MSASISQGRVSVVTVSFNTIEFTALLLWSLHRVLDEDVEVVVVDNGSSDGSGPLLAAASEAGLCRLLANKENIHHGPALNQAMGELVEQPAPPRYVRILDSDVAICRGDVLREALTVAAGGAAIVGERHWDPWHEMHRFELYSLLIDPMQIWRPGAPTFRDDGDPSFELLAAAEEAGLAAKNFPFAAGGYLVHRGRASLAGVVASDDRSHPLYKWAVDHHEPHFGGIPGARERYESILTLFRSEVGALDGPSLTAACASPPT